MLEKEIHIICLNVPYPIDYGVNFEEFYKIKALYDAGIRIHLHCFTYSVHKEQAFLEQFCKSVHYYKRRKKLSLTLPYIVSSRINEDLCLNLLTDDYPILMDGAHCSFLVWDKRFTQRKMFVRVLNVEFLYYKGLFKKWNYSLKNLYYYIESKRLWTYEKKLAKNAKLFAVSPFDRNYFEKELGAENICYIPLFFKGELHIPFDLGGYCFYQGNLSVPENEAAVIWLLENVFNTLKIPFVIAGKNPSKKLIDLSHQYLHTCIAVNPSDLEMQDLMQKAQINLLPSVNETGVKIKLLQALFNGRHCITNTNGANGFEDKSLFHIADDSDTMKYMIEKLMQVPFTENDVQKRKDSLKDHFDLATNAQRLIKWIY